MIERYFFGSWEPDRSDYEQEGLEFLQNVIPINGVLREIRKPVDPMNIYGTPVNYAGKVEGSWPLEVVEGIPADLEGIYLSHANSVTGSRLMHFNHQDPYTETDVSRVAGYGIGSIFRFAQFGAGNVLATAIEEPLQKRTTSGAFVDAITSTTKPQGHYLTTIRSYALMAYIKEGGVYYPHRFWWSARNDIANWEPVADTSGGGWAEINPAGGAITGATGIEDVGLIFTEYGVHRLGYAGGTNLWNRQQIGGREHGKDFFSEPVWLGRDCFYWSRYGPKVVRNAETIEDISGGRVAQFLTDYKRNPYYARDKDTGVDAAVSAIWGVVAFRFKARSVGGGAGTHFVALYNANTDEWGFMGPVIDTTSGFGVADDVEVSLVEMSSAHADSIANEGPGTFPLDDLGLVMFGTNIDNLILAGNLARDDIPSYPYGLTTRLYRGIDGKRTRMSHIRPMVVFADTSPEAQVGGQIQSPVPSGLYPALNTEYTDDAYGYRNTRTLVLPPGATDTAAVVNLDRNGNWLGDLPIVGQTFRFNMQVTGGMSDDLVVSESLGVEVNIEEAGDGG